MPDMAADRRRRRQERLERRAAVTDPDTVMAAAAALLAIRSRTASELRGRLVSMGYAGDLIDHVIERLVALSYLDDAAFAQAWVAGRDRSRPRGAVALRRELLRKGLDRELVDATIATRDQPAIVATDAQDQVDHGTRGVGRGSADHAAAARLLERRHRALMREPDLRKRRQRAYALLARNGFDPGVCMDTVRTSLADADGTASEDEAPSGQV